MRTPRWFSCKNDFFVEDIVSENTINIIQFFSIIDCPSCLVEVLKISCAQLPQEKAVTNVHIDEYQDGETFTDPKLKNKIVLPLTEGGSITVNIEMLNSLILLQAAILMEKNSLDKFLPIKQFWFLNSNKK